MVVDPSRKVQVIWTVGAFLLVLFGALYFHAVREGKSDYMNGWDINGVLMVVGLVLWAIAALGWYWENRNAR